MRAAVSLMLSHGGEPAMSRPDYYQSALHHGCLLVLLRGVGPSKPRSLQKVFEKVRRVNNMKIIDSSGATRDIWIRYVHDHPVENNDWGDFQTHRRLLGLVTIGKFDSQTELNELCRQHESLKVRYSSTLLNSRAVFFGPSATAAPKSTNVNNSVEENCNNDNTATKSSMGAIEEGVASTTTTSTTTTATAAMSMHTKNLQDEYTTPSNFKTTVFFYREHDQCTDLEPQIAEFVSSLFWVLESKRLERSREKVEKVSMLYAPFEKRDFVGLDMESRNNRKRCVGRVTKNLADLSLQTGLVEESLGLYHSAVETLRAVIDSLWLGAAEEGLCAASAILLYPQLREIEALHRNASLQEGSSPLRHTPEKWRASDLTSRIKVSEHTNALQDAMPSAVKMTSTSSSCSSVSSILSNSSPSGGSTPTSSASTSTISAATHGHRAGGSNELPGNILKPDEIPLNYRKAIINYSKYSLAAIVETEAGLKAARICIEQNKPLEVAMFLQNILYIGLSMNEPERVKRLEVITDLYQQIGYRRRAAFFQRLAALKYVQQGNQNPDWSQTYRLLLESFSGYLLSLDPLEVIENGIGWPALQIDLLQSLIAAARRLGHSALATRHMTFLLQTQWENMTPTEQSDMAVQLQNLSAQCEGSPVPLVLENGTVIPPANLTDVPFCIELSVKDLPAYLRPQRIKIVKADSGPFLFTPIHFSSIDRRERSKEKNKIPFFWVQGNMSEVTVRLRNPLPFELTVNDMRLLTNGIVFESLPQTVTLQPHVPTYVKLYGTPIEVGQLEIQGFSTHTLGVKSNCRLKHMRRARQFPHNYLVDVIPSLPSITVSTSLPQTATFSTLASSDLVITSASLTLYNGEMSSCIVTVMNESSLPVEHLEVVITSNVAQDLQEKVFQIDEQALQALLPLKPHSSLEFTVQIYADADFVCPGGEPIGSTHSGSTLTHDIFAPQHAVTTAVGPPSLQYSSTLSSSGHTSLPSRVGSPNQLRRQESNNMSFRSATSNATTTYSGSGVGGMQNSLTLPHSGGGGGVDGASNALQHIEAQFRLKYSGGEAMQAGYCRQCAIAFNLELLPSAQITSWDVLPAEVPSQFYLVLDVSNLTGQEMSLNYTENKSILIEAKESCRVPIPVERCALEQIVAARKAEYEENLEKELCFRTQILSFNESVSKLCSMHIAERVRIHWTLIGSDTQGMASLRGITLPSTMIDITTVSPLQWTVHFQNTPVQPQSEIVCTAGQSASLSITVRNQYSQSLKNLFLTIKFYQDYLNGTENYSLETRVALSGPNQICIPVLHQNEQSHHDYTVLFFTPGRFKTSIQCHSKPASITKAAIGRAQLTDRDLCVDLADAAAMDYHEQQEHIWKFIPPIEVTVVGQ